MPHRRKFSPDTILHQTANNFNPLPVETRLELPLPTELGIVAARDAARAGQMPVHDVCTWRQIQRFARIHEARGFACHGCFSGLIYLLAYSSRLASEPKGTV